MKFAPLTYPYRVIKKDVSALESNATTQYKFNRFWACFWATQMIALPVFIHYFPKYWLGIEFFYVTQASLWANFATHFGAMSAALAAMNTDRTVSTIAKGVTDVSEDVADVSDDVDDIHDVAQLFHAEI